MITYGCVHSGSCNIDHKGDLYNDNFCNIDSLRAKS